MERAEILQMVEALPRALRLMKARSDGDEKLKIGVVVRALKTWGKALESFCGRPKGSCRTCGLRLPSGCLLTQLGKLFFLAGTVLEDTKFYSLRPSELSVARYKALLRGALVPFGAGLRLEQHARIEAAIRQILEVLDENRAITLREM